MAKLSDRMIDYNYSNMCLEGNQLDKNRLHRGRLIICIKRRWSKKGHVLHGASYVASARLND